MCCGELDRFMAVDPGTNLRSVRRCRSVWTGIAMGRKSFLFTVACGRVMLAMCRTIHWATSLES